MSDTTYLSSHHRPIHFKVTVNFHKTYVKVYVYINLHYALFIPQKMF
jgi:hypothetical protein